MFDDPSRNKLNQIHGYKKVESHLQRAGDMPIYKGRICGIENAITAFFIPETIEGISNYLLGNNNGVKRKEALAFAESIIKHECEWMKKNPNDFVALANTPYGSYVSYVGGMN